MKFKIIAPNKEFIGVVATVGFVNGVGETDSDYLASWFSKKGYLVATDETPTVEPTDSVESDGTKTYTEAGLKKLNTAQLDELALELGVDISECQNKAEKADKIWESLNKGE